MVPASSNKKENCSGIICDVIANLSFGHRSSTSTTNLFFPHTLSHTHTGAYLRSAFKKVLYIRVDLFEITINQLGKLEFLSP